MLENFEGEGIRAVNKAEELREFLSCCVFERHINIFRFITSQIISSPHFYLDNAIVTEEVDVDLDVGHKLVFVLLL